MIKTNYSHILLADDDHDDCDFFAEVFEMHFPDIKLSVSHDGGKLMDHLNRPPEPPADIIFLDLNMPVVSGMDCLRMIRESEVLRHKAIVIFSTSSSEDDIAATYALGANYFITKPVNFSDLEPLIRKAMDLVAQGGLRQPALGEFCIKL